MMNTIDLTPLYRSSIGFDRLSSLLNTALRADHAANGYPPYNIEVKAENQYAITLAVAGFSEDELDIQVKEGVLTIRGKKSQAENGTEYLYQGIATRTFERKFNLADYVEVSGAELKQGLLIINLQREIPEAMKPRQIPINSSAKIVSQQSEKQAAA